MATRQARFFYVDANNSVQPVFSAAVSASCICATGTDGTVPDSPRLFKSHQLPCMLLQAITRLHAGNRQLSCTLAYAFGGHASLDLLLRKVCGPSEQPRTQKQLLACNGSSSQNEQLTCTRCWASSMAAVTAAHSRCNSCASPV